MTKALIITTAGINCDLELGHAFELAGAQTERIHLNRLCKEPELVDRFDLIGIPGGFSYGDAVAAGRIMAQLIRQHLYSALVRAVEKGVPIFAPCNGFQIACQVGLLPGPAIGQAWPQQPTVPNIALAHNQKGRFSDEWSRVDIPANNKCIWTQNLTGSKKTLMLPNAHGEGRFVVDDDSIITRLRDSGQIAVQYHTEDNFNGSMDRIAGICDSTGLVLGLMPHPERYTRWTQHPFWTRLEDAEITAEPIGLQMFRNAVEHVTSRQLV